MQPLSGMGKPYQRLSWLIWEAFWKRPCPDHPASHIAAFQLLFMTDLPPQPDTSAQTGSLEPKPLSAPVRYLLMAFALICVLLGLIGAVVPGMPTTVFILMAAWAAVRSSPRLHRWLYAHHIFGPLLRNWDAGGHVSRRVKWTATASMLLSGTLILYVSHKPWLTAVTLSIMGCVLIWLWLRPEPQT